MRDELIKVVEGYLDGLRKKDLSEVGFAPDVTFEGPLSAKLIGERAVADFLTGLFPGNQGHSSQAAHRGRGIRRDSFLTSTPRLG